jgi:hypothetical protein
MSPTGPPRIIAAIGGESQRDAMVAAAGRLSHSVGLALGADWPVQLQLIGLDDPEIPPGLVIVASPMDDPASNDPLALIEARWIARIGRYRSAGHDRILLCNMFRHIDPQVRPAGGIERIRRLNLLAIRLSREWGVEVVDVDRLLALCGARTVGADYRGGGAAAARLTGHAIANAILQGDMAASLPATAQARASATQGDLRDIPWLIERYASRGDRP